MRKSLVAFILTLTLAFSLLSTPAMAYYGRDWNQGQHVNNYINSGSGYRSIPFFRQDTNGMLLRFNNWYVNSFNRVYQSGSGGNIQAPQPETRPEAPAPAPEAKPEQPAPAPEYNPGPTQQPSQPTPAPQPEARPEQPVPAPQPAPTPQGIGGQQGQMLDMVNQERIKAGLKPLAWDSDLANVAQVKAKDMSDNNYFDHNSPTYGSPFEMMKKFGITYRAAGENLAGSGGVDRAHVGLMNSEGHRKNILNPNFTHLGIGVEKSTRYGYVYVQMFVGR
ncbi:MAG TPA: CAP domain-containing protein [Clostridia bacterium]|nr:CAP domain-containing protein [Clostridia bacterium]